LFFNLGHGNFGSVMKGTYILSASKKIPIAVKTLKEEDIPGQKVWLASYVFRNNSPFLSFHCCYKMNTTTICNAKAHKKV